TLTSFHGILTSAGAANVTISNNPFVTSYTVAAIQIDGATTSSNVQILNNQIISAQGIVMANATKAKIDGNSITALPASATAIHLAGAVTSSEVAGNTLANDGHSSFALFGIHLDETLVASPDTGNKITGNTIVSRSGTAGPGFNVGIALEGCSQNTISGN